MRSAKMIFISDWKVAGELVRPKNMTLDSKRPLLVTKATFHSSPSLILKGCFPFVSFLNPDVVIAPSNVKLSEDLGAFELVDDVRS